MTVIILFIILLQLIIISYHIFNKNIFSPLIMTSLGYIIALLVLIINMNKWDYTMSFKTFFVILTSILAIGFGEVLARITYKKTNKSTIENRLYINNDVSVKIYKTIICIVFMSLFALYYYYDIRKVAGHIGFSGFSDMFSAYNKAQKQGYSLSIVSTIGYSASFVITSIYIYINLNMAINKNQKIKIINTIPIILYLIINIISSNRMGYIYIIITGVLMGYIIWMRKYQWKKHINRKIIKYCIGLLIIFFIVFILLGLITGKTQHFNSPLESISLYTSGSIVALDNFLDGFKYSIHNLGTETLYGINRIIAKLGADVVIAKRNLPQTYISSDLMSNVYSSIRRYLNDYNYLGLYLIQIMIGYFYTKILKNIELHKYKNENLIIIIYSSFYYPVVMQFVDDLLFSIFLSQTFVFQIIMFIILYKFILSSGRVELNNQKNLYMEESLK